MKQKAFFENISKHRQASKACNITDDDIHLNLLYIYDILCTQFHAHVPGLPVLGVAKVSIGVNSPQLRPLPPPPLSVRRLHPRYKHIAVTMIKTEPPPIQFAAYLASNKKCALLSIEAFYIQPVLFARLFSIAQMTSQNFQKMSQTGSSRPSRSGSFSSDFAPPSRVNLEKICSKAPQVLI